MRPPNHSTVKKIKNAFDDWRQDSDTVNFLKVFYSQDILQYIPPQKAIFLRSHEYEMNFAITHNGYYYQTGHPRFPEKARYYIKGRLEDLDHEILSHISDILIHFMRRTHLRTIGPAVKTDIYPEVSSNKNFLAMLPASEEPLFLAELESDLIESNILKKNKSIKTKKL